MCNATRIDRDSQDLGSEGREIFNSIVGVDMLGSFIVVMGHSKPERLGKRNYHSPVW